MPASIPDPDAAPTKQPPAPVTAPALATDSMAMDPASLPPAATPQRLLQLRSLQIDDLPTALELDQACFGGMWSAAGYQREIESPNSDLLGLFATDGSVSPSAPPSPIAPAPTESSVLPLPPWPDTPAVNLGWDLIGVGCVWAILEEAHLTLLGIHPDYRRQGLGNYLLCQLLRSAQQRGLERATLEVRRTNQAAIALYKNFGFQRAGCRRNYYPDDEDALILWRNHLHRPAFQADIAQQEDLSARRLGQYAWQPR